jgi:cytochrome c553
MPPLLRSRRVFPALLVLPLLALIAAAPARAEEQAGGDIAEKATLCQSCHGVEGIPVDPSIPVIWGQNEGYLYIELRDFARGARASQVMGEMAKSLSREDMKALARYFAAKPWPALGQKPADAATAERARVIANSAQCSQCHLDGFLGASLVPRLAGQSATYLLTTMKDFRSGARANNPWMSDLLKAYSEDDLAVLAAYLAGL